MDNFSDISAQIGELSGRISANPGDAEALYRRGKLYWKAGERGAALTDLNAATAIDPDCGAAEYLKMLGDIMDFYHTDLYNP